MPSGNALTAMVAAALVVALTLIVALWPGSRLGAPAAQLPGSPAAPTAAEITPMCNTTTPASVLGPATSLPANPTTTVVMPSGGVEDFTATASALYVDTGTHLVTYTLSGTQTASFALPAQFTNNSASTPVIDPAGNIYLSSYYGKLVDKFSPAGVLLWSVDPQAGNPTGLFSVGTGSGFQLVVSLVQNSASSVILNTANGAVSGTFPLIDNGYVTQEANGNLLYSANGYIETISPAGKVLSTFGSSRIEGNGVHAGSGTQIFYPAQAAQGPDGTIYTADPLQTVEATTPSGLLKATTTLGGHLAFGGWNFVLVGSTFYYQSGPPFSSTSDGISSFTLATLQTYLSAIQAPPNTLGWGAGLSTPATGNYFAPGSTPAVVASFDPWWTSLAPNLKLAYSVEDTTSLDAGTIPAPQVISLPTGSTGLASIPLPIPSFDTVPGPYEVRATLLDERTSPPTTLGTTCMPYTVGAPGNNLSLSTLPSGAGSGGPADPRGVALNAQLGLSGFRSTTAAPWSTILPKCNGSAPTAATCGPAAMTFANASQDPYKAAFLGTKNHVAYWMQVSDGGPVSTALVHGGWWQQDVAALVAHYAKVPAGCANCSPVTAWEAWNESNNTGWGNGGTYVTSVLAPFHAAVKAALPGSASTVIGGSTLEPSPGWWQQLIAAGGLADMDVAAIHPYAGSNGAYEEEGMQTQVRQLQALLGAKPLWFTEIGWWSDGDVNFLGQADNVARSLIWQKVLGIPVESYFFDEGSWGNDGVSFSLIQASNGVDYVKPAALATMTTSGVLAGRPYLSMPATGIPQSYRADFGATTAGTNHVTAIWTDGLPVTGSVTLTDPGGATRTITATNEFGRATPVQATSGAAYSLPLSGHVTYLTYPAEDTLTVGPTEDYGTDLAAASAGATATASSGNATAAISGFPIGYGQGWASANGDTSPSLTVTLQSTSTVDRVIVDTQSAGSTAPSVRNYIVSGNVPGTGWVTLATETGQLRDHELQFAFDPVAVSALRIAITEVNFGGYFGGGIPAWWPSTQGEYAFLHAFQAYGGSGGPAVVAGSGLPPLLTSSTTGGGGTGGGSGGATTTTDPGVTATSGVPTSTPVAPAAHGDSYRVVTSAAQVATFGAGTTFGPDGALGLNKPIVGMATYPGGTGYWLVGADGGIFNFGAAGFHGSTGSLGLNAPIVGMASTTDGNGYWLVGADGGIFAAGDASYLGSTGALTLNKPVVGMTATSDGKGYWLVASDGGIFAFGDAGFFGSTGALQLNKPIVGMSATADGKGYWLAASDGGIFAFGDAVFHGSTGGLHLNADIVGMAGTSDGKGYWLAASDGGIFAFGDASYLGSAQVASSQPVVGIAAG